MESKGFANTMLHCGYERKDSPEYIILTDGIVTYRVKKEGIRTAERILDGKVTGMTALQMLVCMDLIDELEQGDDK